MRLNLPLNLWAASVTNEHWLTPTIINSGTRNSNIKLAYTPFIMLFTGLLKEYLRELPEPVFSNCLYQMLVDAMGVFLPDDPDGNAKLVFSILDCLPKANRVSIRIMF